jgi:hypothetical protein
MKSRSVNTKPIHLYFQNKKLQNKKTQHFPHQRPNFVWENHRRAKNDLNTSNSQNRSTTKPTDFPSHSTEAAQTSLNTLNKAEINLLNPGPQAPQKRTISRGIKLRPLKEDSQRSSHTASLKHTNLNSPQYSITNNTAIPHNTRLSSRNTNSRLRSLNFQQRNEHTQIKPILDHDFFNLISLPSQLTTKHNLNHLIRNKNDFIQLCHQIPPQKILKLSRLKSRFFL